MDMPKNERNFVFEEIGDTTNNKWEGTFLVKCVLTIGEKKKLEIEKSRQMVDMVNPTEDLRILATVIANLKIRIVNGPDWWKQFLGEDMLDHNIIYALYSKVVEQEDLWRQELKEKIIAGNLQTGL